MDKHKEVNISGFTDADQLLRSERMQIVIYGWITNTWSRVSSLIKIISFMQQSLDCSKLRRDTVKFQIIGTKGKTSSPHKTEKSPFKKSRFI